MFNPFQREIKSKVLNPLNTFPFYWSSKCVVGIRNSWEVSLTSRSLVHKKNIFFGNEYFLFTKNLLLERNFCLFTKKSFVGKERNYCSPKISLLQYSCSITVSVACLHQLKSKESQGGWIELGSVKALA